MKQNKEQIDKPQRLASERHQAFRNKLYFEEELRKLVPDLIRAEKFGLSEKDMDCQYFDYYTSGEPNVKHTSYFYLRNGLIEFKGILTGDIEKRPINNSQNYY